MSNPPNIVISKLDLQRLDKILDPMKYPLDSLETLENEIARARIVSHTRIPRVHVLDEITGREFFVTLVYPEDAGDTETVSVLAPVGMALLGLKTGHSIEWTSPQCRPLKLKVLDVSYQPEAHLAFDL